VKQTLWCDACERNELVVARAFWMMLFQRPMESRKQVCGDEGVLKLTSRWLSTRSLDAPRGAAADPPHRFEDQPDGIR
jgi:hypothetical protein